MYNPSYLVKSRHDIFYFRYPLPIKPLQGNRSPRVCVSLKTRCPKEALSLAKALEYHSSVLIDELDLEHMDHSAVMSVMKSYYAGLLESRKAKIDAEGPLPKKKVQSISNILEELNMVIEDGDYDDPTEYYGVEYENPEDDPLKEDLSKIIAQNDLRFAPDSKEYQMMKSAHKYLRRNYYNDLLAYNRGVTDFSFLDKGQNTIKLPVNHYKPEHRLGKVIESYMTEIKSNITKRSYNERYDCLNYLTDWLSADFPIGKIDDAKVREVKELLIKTPNGRNCTSSDNFGQRASKTKVCFCLSGLMLSCPSLEVQPFS